MAIIINEQDYGDLLDSLYSAEKKVDELRKTVIELKKKLKEYEENEQ